MSDVGQMGLGPLRDAGAREVCPSIQKFFDEIDERYPTYPIVRVLDFLHICRFVLLLKFP